MKTNKFDTPEYSAANSNVPFWWPMLVISVVMIVFGYLITHS